MNLRRCLPVVACLLAVGMGWNFVRGDDKPQSDDSAEKKPASVTPAEKNPERHERFMKDRDELQKKGPIELVFEGDSITDGWRGPGRAIFEEDYAKPYNCFNTGIGGDRTEHLLWRIDHGELDGLHPKAVVLMIGTNNLGTGQSVQDTVAGITAVVEAIHQTLPEAKILLLGVFPRGHEKSDAMREKINDVNDGIKKLEGKDNVTYLDIGPKFLEENGALEKNIMPDYLHPNEKGYMIWAEAMRPALDELMK